MNSVSLTGNLVREIELRITQSGAKVVSNVIAVQRNFKENGEYKTDFINFVAWNNQADYLANYAMKGDKLELTGRLQVRTFQDRNNATQSVVEVIVEYITAIPTATREEKPKDFKGSDLDAIDLPDDDLPF